MQVLLGLAIGLPIVDFTKAALGKDPNRAVGFEEAVVFTSFLIIAIYFFWSYIGAVAKYQNILTFRGAAFDLLIMLSSIGVLFVMGQVWSDIYKFTFFAIILLSIDLIWEMEILIVYKEYRRVAIKLIFSGWPPLKRFVKCFVSPYSRDFNPIERGATAALWWLFTDVLEIALLLLLWCNRVSPSILALVVFGIQLLVPFQIFFLRHQFWIYEEPGGPT